MILSKILYSKSTPLVTYNNIWKLVFISIMNTVFVPTISVAAHPFQKWHGVRIYGS